MRKALAVVTVAILLSLDLLSRPSQASEMTVDEKMMYAASAVLETFAVGSSGKIIVGDPQTAHEANNSIFGQPADVTLKKLGNCTYGVIISSKPDSYPIIGFIDFDKLSGEWAENNGKLFFYGSQRASCLDFSGENSCSDGVYFGRGSDQRQVVNNISYILRHGCSASVNTDLDPY